MAHDARSAAGTLGRLCDALDAARQSLRSHQLIASGYVGSGLKSEMRNAARLEQHLTSASRIAQEMIMSEVEFVPGGPSGADGSTLRENAGVSGPNGPGRTV